MTRQLVGAIIETRRKKSKAILECKNPAEMQKGLEPRDTKRVCRLGLRDNSLGLLQNAKQDALNGP